MDIQTLLPRMSVLRRLRSRVIAAAGVQSVLEFESAWGLFEPNSTTWYPSQNANRIIDFGSLDTVITDDLLAPFESAGLPRVFLYLDPYPVVEQARAALKKAGFVKCIDLKVLARDLTGPIEERVWLGVETRIATHDDEADIEHILTYRGTQPAMWRDKVLGSLTEDGAAVHIATVDGEPAAVGVVNTVAGIAYLSNGTTIPELRGRGAQKALILSRLRAAKQVGSSAAFVETYCFLAASFNNLIKTGFVEFFQREIFRYEFDPSIRAALVDSDQGHPEPKDCDS